MWIELKVNNKYTTPMSVMLFWWFYCYLSSIVFIVYFEQVVARWTGDAIVSDKFILNIYGENIALLSWEKLSDCKFVSLFIQNTGQRGPIPTFLTFPLLKFWLHSFIFFVYCNRQTNQRGCSHTMDMVLKPTSYYARHKVEKG